MTQISGSALVRPKHPLQCRLNEPPRLGFFALALIFQGASFLGRFGDGFVAMGFKQLPRVILNVGFWHLSLLTIERHYAATPKMIRLSGRT